MKSMLKVLYHQLFEVDKQIIENEHIKIDSKQCHFVNNRQYGKDENNNTFDFLCPKEKNKKYPTIFLIHGGGYVGGFKEGLNEVALSFVKKGYAVVNIEYTHSDGIENKFMPTPIYEIFDLFKYIKNNKEFSDYIDYNNIFLYGDSSGGHIASLIANIQSNPNLKFDFNLTGGPQIKALLLTCPVFGAYNFANFPIKKDFHNIVYGQDNIIKEICHSFDVITDLFPPTLLVSTQKDIVARVHTNMFLKKAKELNLNVDFFDIRKGYKLTHDSMIVYYNNYPKYKNLMLKFLDNAVKNRFVKGVKKTQVEDTIKLKDEELEK